MAYTTTVWATFRMPALHRWPDAPDACQYLRWYHRHEFHVRVEVAVTSDRQVEFVQMKEIARREFAALGQSAYDDVWTFNDLSCEALAAKLLLRLIALRFDVTLIEVSEDGENGAAIHR